MGRGAILPGQMSIEVTHPYDMGEWRDTVLSLEQKIKQVDPIRLKIGAVLRGDIDRNDVQVLRQIQGRAINTNSETTGI